MENKLTFEESMQRLEEITKTLENNETTLDEAIGLYKEGVELSAFCKQKLDSAKLQISMLEDK
ncbi:MAG: exodeoxyribonuclease VII small subunit [Oscillospiraceae bacterium]|nr:exodeoxyribonuclease VII small subunit [Oscillospiraceae bacterium]